LTFIYGKYRESIELSFEKLLKLNEIADKILALPETDQQMIFRMILTKNALDAKAILEDVDGILSKADVGVAEEAEAREPAIN
jgi:hypothetical protein